MSVTAFYAGWRRYQELISRALRSMPDDEIGLEAPFQTDGSHWPIWAIAAHTAGARVYWLCLVLGEPGIQTATAFMKPETFEGWEDDLSHPRSATEVADAFDTSWTIVAGCLERWTPELLDEPIAVETPRGTVHYTRQSILLRLITHDAYHAGEIALIQGAHGRPQIDLWPPGAHSLEAMAG